MLPRSRHNRRNTSHKKVTRPLHQIQRRRTFQGKAVEEMRGIAPHSF